MKTHEFKERLEKAKRANNTPDTDGNYMVFGVRKECIRPTILNAMRERLGYNPRFNVFNQCQAQRPRR